MGGCSLDQDRLEAVIAFHGHWCPGLAIGIRSSEVCLAEVGHAADEEVVAVVETDMCGVDAIQYLTGCTFGKGNLLYRDLGKNAFTFFRRSDGKAVRVSMRTENYDGPGEEFIALQQRVARGEATDEDRRKIGEKKDAWADRIMESDLRELFEVRPVSDLPPHRARILAGLVCEDCGERTMESRTRRLDGRVLCIPCFEARDNRL
jgi:formylmethanofuran dehydrogenase subunit E